MVKFDHVPTVRRELIDFPTNVPIGEFVPHLPGFLNVVLAYPDDKMRKVLDHYGRGTESTHKLYLETLTETHIIGEFMEAEATFIPGTSCRVMDLYEAYRHTCSEGNQKAIPLKGFSTAFIKLSKQLGHKGVDRKRKSDGWHMLNVTLRDATQSQHIPTFITREIL